MQEDATVVVAGGGLAGLVAARHLAAAGVDVRLFEREDEVGGRVRTDREDGFTFDRGFQVLFTDYPAAERELDFDALDLRAFTPGACIARPGERSILSDPLRDIGALTDSVFNREVRLRDKWLTLQLRRELSKKSREAIFEGPDRSIREYLRDYGFSEAFVENFAAPFYGGITLDRSLSTSKRVFEYTFRALSNGSIAVPARGMAAIPEQIASRAEAAGAAVETDAAVDAVDAGGSGDGAATGGGPVTVSVGGETVDADAAVVATDPQSARDLAGVGAIPTEARSCVTQYYAYPALKRLDAGKRLILNAGGADPNHVVDISAVAPEYAPDDTTLLSATFLGEREESDAELEDLTREALAGWYPEHSFADLELVRTERVPFAQFDQPPGFRETLPGVRAPDGPVYLAGDYTGWSSINAALESGRRAAEAALADLEERA
ncbi:FAD-dependent oxidoreductase [Halostella sp. JP-L12]|uniref:NAD(P)/FAD-dependent oxidoreductase n=1 Tax=Halostella TaxID=1843185 RepID=UPI000EF8198D|nr:MULTISPECIES: NAD(P)/FAD-dependent oxidoreductase [Halostella]NHN47599.1 FAD-dependent oxidoreductase [Halostella sp. JP-L12]